MLTEGVVGIQNHAEGTVSRDRHTRLGAKVTADGQPKDDESASWGTVFSEVLAAWSTTIAAGNINAAAADASTQFAVWNPTGNTKNLALLKFAVWPISGTAPIPPVYHSFSSTAPSIAHTVVTPVTCNNVGIAGTSSTGAGVSFGGWCGSHREHCIGDHTGCRPLHHCWHSGEPSGPPAC